MYTYLAVAVASAKNTKLTTSPKLADTLLGEKTVCPLCVWRTWIWCRPRHQLPGVVPAGTHLDKRRQGGVGQRDSSEREHSGGKRGDAGSVT